MYLPLSGPCAGYIRITRHPNDCGIASEPIYVDMKLA